MKIQWWVALAVQAGTVLAGATLTARAGSESGEVDPKVDAILTRLEARGNEIHDIACRIKLVDDDRINLSKRERTGKIRFMVKEPNPVWQVHFDHTVIDGAKLAQEWYLFDGRWLYEAQERIKQVVKREVIHEDEKVDFFDLENTPFPLPFGQKKDNILRHFNVTLAPPAEGDPAETDHLVCMPREGSSMARRYDRLDFFVRRDIDLPCRVVATKNDGYEITTADFPDLSSKSINAGLKEKDFRPPKAWSEYEEIVEKLN